MSSLADNPNCARTYATFRLAGDALVPSEVTSALGLTPTLARAKGEEVPVGTKGKTTRLQRTGIWLLDSDGAVESTSLERHIVYLLDKVDPAISVLAELRTRRDLAADFFCYWVSATGQGGPEVSPRTLRRMADLDAPFGIDFYCDDD